MDLDADLLRDASLLSRIEKEVRLQGAAKECSWGSHTATGLTYLRSHLTGMRYLIDVSTGEFVRTASQDTTRLVPCSPREVIAKDRSWLFALFDQIPGGRAVLARYSNSSHKEDKVPTPTKAEAARAAPAVQIEPSLASLTPQTSEKRIVLTETTKTLELGPHQVVALLRRHGITVPDKATVSWTAAGYVRLTWTETKESVEE